MEPKYLLIGSGRASTHLGHYFRLLGLSVQFWSRRESKQDLAERAKSATHVLVLINDPAIESFVEEHSSFFRGKTLVHASGALSTPRAEGAHPLMTFTDDSFYDLGTYRSIPFILERGRKPFADILPGLPNPHFEISAELKPLYHALCVLSGNFTVILWQKAFSEFENKLSLPRQVLLPYLERVAANLQADSGSALTGPLARGDQKTIETHLQVLAGDPFESVYKAFVEAVQTLSKTSSPKAMNSPTGGWK